MSKLTLTLGVLGAITSPFILMYYTKITFKVMSGIFTYMPTPDLWFGSTIFSLLSLAAVGFLIYHYVDSNKHS